MFSLQLDKIYAWWFFSCRGEKRGWAGVPASASLQARARGPVQADCNKIFFRGKVNICQCHEFGSNSKNNVRVVNIFLSYSNNEVGCFEIFWSYSNQFSVILIQSKKLASSFMSPVSPVFHTVVTVNSDLKYVQSDDIHSIVEIFRANTHCYFSLQYWRNWWHLCKNIHYVFISK